MVEGGSRGSFLNKILALHPVTKKLLVNHAALYIVKGDNFLLCKLRATLVFFGADESFYARDGGETPQVTAPGAASPPPPQVAAPSPPTGTNTDNKAATFVNESPSQKVETFDEFDPRSAFSGTAYSKSCNS